MNNNALMLRGFDILEVKLVNGVHEYASATNGLLTDCPKCGSVGRLYRHGTKTVDYRDTPIGGKNALIRCLVQRWRCRDCNETSMQPLPDMDNRHRMTKRCVEHIQKQGMPRTYAAVARDIGVDEKTVRNICNAYAKQAMGSRRIETPIILGIDELTLQGRKRTIFVDVGRKRLLDIIDAMNRGRVESWLRRFEEDRNKVEVVTIDMWGPYKESVRRTLPRAKLVVDKWHVVSKANIALDRVRNRWRRQRGIRKNPQKGRRLLQTHGKNLSPMRRLLLDGVLANNLLFAAAWSTKEAFYAIWSHTDRHKAEAAYAAWRATIPASVEQEFGPIAKMVDNWHAEIFAYFDYPVTNAYTESTNGLVKKLNRAGNGYTFEHIRAKALQMEPSELRACPYCLGHYPESSFREPKTKPFPGQVWTGVDAVCGGCHYRLHQTDWTTYDDVSPEELRELISSSTLSHEFLVSEIQQ